MNLFHFQRPSPVGLHALDGERFDVVVESTADPCCLRVTPKRFCDLVGSPSTSLTHRRVRASPRVFQSPRSIIPTSPLVADHHVLSSVRRTISSFFLSSCLSFCLILALVCRFLTVLPTLFCLSSSLTPLLKCMLSFLVILFRSCWLLA